MFSGKEPKLYEDFLEVVAIKQPLHPPPKVLKKRTVVREPVKYPKFYWFPICIALDAVEWCATNLVAACRFRRPTRKDTVTCV
ncbi:unnamed protein product [Caenorhabditis nigoni]